MDDSGDLSITQHFPTGQGLVYSGLLKRWCDPKSKECPGCGHLVGIVRARVRQKKHEGLRWHTKCLEKAIANATLRSLGE